MKSISSNESIAYSARRYFVPSAIPASQPAKSKRVRVRKHYLNTPFTYKIMLENQARMVEQKLTSSRTAANRATALRGFLKANCLCEDDIVGLEMRRLYPEACERYGQQMQQDGRTSRNISNSLSALRPWKEAVIVYDTAQAVESQKPTPFMAVLREIFEGQNVALAARNMGVAKGMLHGWLNGKKPRNSNAMYISRLEAYFGLDRGYLLHLAGIKEQGKRVESVGGTPRPIEFRNRVGELTRIIFCLKPGPATPLREQWENYVRYKTAASLVMDGLKRTRRGRWRISPCPITARTDSNWWAFLPDRRGQTVDYKEVASARIAWAKTAAYLGWLRLGHESGGANVPESDVETLAWLAVPDHIERYLDWTKSRVRARNQGATQFLAYIASLVRPEAGYLCQTPQLQATLPEPYRSADWDELCKKTFELTHQLSAAYDDEMQVSRDSFAPIMHILQMAQPMDAIADMVQRMRADRPVLDPKAEAIWARDIVLIKLLASNPIRRRNLIHLTWRADNTGELHQREDGSWWLKIHKSRFKNTRGAAGAREFYECQVNAAAWTDIERYVRVHRPRLIRGPTDLFFLNSSEGPGKSNDTHLWTELGRRVEKLTAKYLYKCPGIGTHAFRHIVATAILKATGGDFKTAALVLNDKVATVEKHYAFLTANDGAERMGQLLAASFSRM